MHWLLQLRGRRVEAEAGRADCRGRCDAALPGNMGKLMRSMVVRNLREGMKPQGAGEAPQAQKAPEINVCCHGQDAGNEVAHTNFPTDHLSSTGCPGRTSLGALHHCWRVCGFQE